MTWILNNTWSIPLVITVLVWVLFIIGLVVAETGEDAMGMAGVFAMAVIVTLASWTLWLLFILAVKMF